MWSHDNALTIQLVTVLLLGINALTLFSVPHTPFRKRYADATFVFLVLLLAVFEAREFYLFGSQILWLLAWQVGTLSLMATAYYLPMRIRQQSPKWYVAAYSLLYVVSSWIFAEVFLLSEILPVNVMINWG